MLDYMRPRPYVSVSGVMDADDVLDRVFGSITTRTEQIAGKHGLALGILVSEKTLRGDGNKYPNRYPTPAYDRAWRAAARDGALNFVHYCADSSEKLGSSLVDAVRAVEQNGRKVHGVQVNVGWPDSDQLRMFTNAYPNKRIILQVMGDPADEWTQYIGDYLADRYAWVITDVLLDGSGGRGKPIDVEAIAPVVSRLAKEMPHLGVGIAWGLAGVFSKELMMLLRTYPHLSIDAEGALRDDVADGGGHLNLDKVVDYLTAARAIFGKE